MNYTEIEILRDIVQEELNVSTRSAVVDKVTDSYVNARVGHATILKRLSVIGDINHLEAGSTVLVLSVAGTNYALSSGVFSGSTNLPAGSSAASLGSTYYDKTEINDLLSRKADAGHSHRYDHLEASTGTLGGFEVGADYIRSAIGNFAITSNVNATRMVMGSDTDVVVMDGKHATYRLWAGHDTPASAPFSVEKDGKIHASAGDIAGWDILTNKLSKNNVELDPAGQIKVGTGEDVAVMGTTQGNWRLWIGSATPGLAPFRVDKDGNAWLDSATIALTLESDNFETGVQGWKLWNTGEAEFQDVTVRGRIEASVFAKTTMSGVSGQMTISIGDNLLNDCEATSTTIDVLTDAFSVSDIIQLKPDASRNEWMRIVSGPTVVTGGYQYVVERSYDGSGPFAFEAGTAVMRKGNAGDIRAPEGLAAGDIAGAFGAMQPGGGGGESAGGWIILDGEASSLSVITREGPVWNQFATQVRLGNLSGVLDYSSETYGLFIGDDNDYLAYDETNGLRMQFLGAGYDVKITSAGLEAELLILDQITAPGAGPSGSGHLYAKTGDDGLFWHAYGGSEVDLTDTGAGHSETHVLATTGPHTGELPWADMAAGTQGSIVRRGASDWEEYALGTTNYVLKAGASDVAWGQVAHSELAGVTSDLHHPQAHDIEGADHTASGLTAGHVMRASAASAFSFAALQAADLPSHTHVEGDITDLKNYAEYDQTETISGAWTYSTSPTLNNNTPLNMKILAGAPIAVLNVDVLDNVEVGNSSYILELLGSSMDPPPALNANWDAGGYEIRSLKFQSDQPTGTAPFIVASTTKVTNLNADLLDDQSGSHYLDSANFTGTNWTDLTDAGETSLHTHPAATPAAHVLATTAGLGAQHTTSGLTAGQVLRATAATTAAFQSLVAGDIPTLDHGSGLSGLDDDDHGAIYPGINQTETITGTWTFDGTATYFEHAVQFRNPADDTDYLSMLSGASDVALTYYQNSAAKSALVLSATDITLTPASATDDIILAATSKVYIGGKSGTLFPSIENFTAGALTLQTGTTDGDYILFASHGHFFIDFQNDATGADEVKVRDSADAELFTIDSDGNVEVLSSMIIGSMTTAPDGPLHVMSGSAGTVSAEASGDELIVESSGDGGFSVLTPDANYGGVYFGSPSNNKGAWFSYKYNTTFSFEVAGAPSLGFNTLTNNVDIIFGSEDEQYMVTIDAGENKIVIGQATVDNDSVLAITDDDWNSENHANVTEYADLAIGGLGTSFGTMNLLGQVRSSNTGYSNISTNYWYNRNTDAWVVRDATYWSTIYQQRVTGTTGEHGFYIYNESALWQYMQIGGDASTPWVYINKDNNDIDFIVDGDNDNNLIRTVASADAVAIGGTTVANADGTTTRLYVYSDGSSPSYPLGSGTDGASNIFVQQSAGASGSWGAGFLARHTRGSIASPSQTLSGDRLGFFLFGGIDNQGTPAWGNQAGFISYAAESYTSTGKGTRLELVATPTGSTSRQTIITIQDGVQIGSPSGGDLGAGILNVDVDVYLDNSKYTNPDYVLEHYYRGEISEFLDRPGAEEYEGLKPIDVTAEFMEANLHLPWIEHDNPSGLGGRNDMLLVGQETMMLHIIGLNKEVKKLNRELKKLRKIGDRVSAIEERLGGL